MMLSSLLTMSCGGEDDETGTEPEVLQGTATSADGTEIWYRAVGGTEPGAKTVLLMHGGPGLASGYLSGLEQLAGPTRRIVRLDQRGVGGSADPPAYDYHSERIMEDIDAVLSELGVNELTFLGHSWGGFVGMTYAIREPARLDGLVLVGSLPPTSASTKMGFAERQKRIEQLQDAGKIPASLPDPISDLCGWVAAILPVYFGDPDFSPPPALTSNQCDNAAARLTWDQNFSTGFDITAELGKLDLPVVLLYGEADFLAGQANTTAQSFTPDAPVSIVPDVGHFPWIEAADTTLPLIRSLLDGS